MMDFYKIQKLQDNALKLLGNKIRKNIEDKDKEEELDWNYSLFVAHILSKSELVLQLNKQTLQQEINNYNNKFSKSIAIESLQSKQWIRFIFDEIEIPSNLFWFCKDIHAISDLDKKYQEYFDEIYFIGLLYNKYGYDDLRNFKISINDFLNIYDKFKILYPKIPNKTELIKQFKFTNSGNDYFYQPSNFHKSFSSKIAANLWMLLDNPDIIIKSKKWLLLLKQFYLGNFTNHLSSNQFQLYSENILKLLFQEEDLFYNSKIELKKIVTDFHSSSHSNIDIFFQDTITDFSFPEKVDLFLLWCFLKKFLKNFDCDSYFLGQECRIQYYKILTSLLDIEDSKKYIKQIFDNGKKSPYLFFAIIFYLTNNRPSEMLWFIDEKEYGIILYIDFIEACITKLEQDNKIVETGIINLIKESARIFIHSNLNQKSFDYTLLSRLLMWLPRYSLHNDRRLSILQIKKDIYNFHIELILKNIDLCCKEFEIAKLINNFYEEKDYIFPNNHNINISHFIYFFNLLEIVKLKNNPDFKNTIVEEIKKLYKTNVLESKSLFLTSEYKEIESFDWSFVINSLIDKTELENFCKQTIDFYIVAEKSESEEFHTNHTNADRYKLLLKILCLAYQKSNSIYRTKIEKSIIDFLSYCFIDNIESKKINIFSSLYESSYTEIASTSLFPLLVECINSFSEENQKNFMNLLLTNADFTLLFKAYNLIKFEIGHKQIENFIKNKNFSSKIDEIYTIPDFINVLTEVINSRLDEDFEKILLDELQKIIKYKAKIGHISEYTYQAELLKLFYLFKNEEVEQLKKYELPFVDKSGQYTEYQNRINSEKLFYLANFDLQNDNFKEAFSKFDKLTKQYPNNLKYKYYKLYVQSCIVTKNDKTELQKLLKETSNYLEKDYAGKKILLLTKLKLHILSDELEEALYFYQTLNPDLRDDIDFAYIIIKALIDKDDLPTALKVFSEIKSEFYNHKKYKELRKKLPTDKIIEKFHNEYSQMLSLSDEQRFRVLPDKINKHDHDLGKYILNEIKYAINKTLKKIDLVKKISENHLSEDNISDLLELEIAGRLSMLGYKLNNQDRSGKSASGKNAGEIDLEINFDDFSIVIEAVKYSSGSTKRKEHIEKIFNYDPSRRYLYNLIYFDSTDNFDTSWKKVFSEIEASNYPSGYERKETQEMPSSNGSIKIAISKHNGNLTFYHVMAHFCYADNP